MNHASSLFVGINLGVSEVSGVCVDSRLQTKASASSDFGSNRNSRRDPQAWWDIVQRVILNLVDQVDPEAIVSIAVAGTSGTTVAVDDAGNPLSHALLYNDLCKDEKLIKRIAVCAPDTSAVNGSRSGLAKAITLCSAFRNANIMCEADWITFKLSGLLGLSDENNALRAGYDPIERQWPDWLKHAGMNPNALPHVLPAGQTIGTVKKEICQKIRLSSRTLVVSGTIDSCASFIATGAANPGDGVTSLGKRLNIKLLCDKPVYAPHYGIYSQRIGNYWLTGGGTDNAQRTVCEHFTAQEVEELCQGFDNTTPMSLGYYSLACPANTALRGTSRLATNLSLSPSNHVEFLNGILKTMANIEALAYRRLQELGASPVATIRTTGKGSLNELWTSVRINTVLARFYSTTSDRAAVGAALLARNAVFVNPVIAYP